MSVFIKLRVTAQSGPVSGANVYPPDVWFADVMLSFSGVTFVLFCFVFVFLLSQKPRPFVQSFFVLPYACAPTATRSYLTTVCVLFLLLFLPFFVSLEMSFFPSIFVP